MVEDPFPAWGLKPVELGDQARMRSYFEALSEPISDYTFAQVFCWRNSLKLRWAEFDSHLCVFANGSGDLTLLLPPIGQGDPGRAMARCTQLMDEYNAAQGLVGATRTEYVSRELAPAMLDCNQMSEPMGHDYVYSTRSMIDLDGGPLASKRQARNRFQRLYDFRVELYDPARHAGGCHSLLRSWKTSRDAQEERSSTVARKRQKEVLSCELTLDWAFDLGLTGMVVWVRGGSDLPCDADGFSIRAFTFGEKLSPRQASIVVEKTDLGIKGLAQFVFSEFCRQCWADVPSVNVGDDWGLKNLAWTKSSYGPVDLLPKFVLRPRVAAGSIPETAEAREAADHVLVA